MKVVDPSNASHTLLFVPRYYPDTAVVLELTNEVDRVEVEPSTGYCITDGKMSIVFAYTFVEGDKFKIKITEGDSVVYRGKLFATSQDPQQYKLTEGLYTYE